MATRLRAWAHTLRRRPSSARKISGLLYAALPLEIPIEEETLPRYEPEQYYPVHIGDVFNAKYQVVGKLGYGAYSTSWLCRDVRDDNEYTVVKVSTSLRKFPTATHRELKIYEHLTKVDSAHPGQSLIRELYDAFDLAGPAGRHQCLVQQPMHMTIL